MLGKVIQGSVKDCDRASLERQLKDYDRQLYIRWNATKNYGRGCWEIRRHPEQKTLVKKCEGFAQLELVENDLVHHVLDVPYLTRDILGKLKKMDTWVDSFKGKNWSEDSDYKAKLAAAQIEADSRRDLKYHIKQHSKEWKDLVDAMSKGEVSPSQVFKGFK